MSAFRAAFFIRTLWLASTRLEVRQMKTVTAGIPQPRFRLLFLCTFAAALLAGMSALPSGSLAAAATEPVGKPILIRTNIKHETAQLDSVYLSADGSRLAVTRQEFGNEATECLAVYDATSGKELPPVTEEGEQPAYVAWSPNGKYVALATAPNIANRKKLKPIFRVRDVAAQRDVFTYPTHDFGIEPCAFTPDSRQLLYGARNGPGGTLSLDLVDLPSGKVVHRLVPPEDEFGPGQLGIPQFSSDGRLLLYSTGSGDWLSVWDVQAEKRIRRFRGPAPEGWLGAAFLADAKQVRAVARDGTIVTWDLASGREASRVRLKADVAEDTIIRFRDDGHIVLTTRPGAVAFWSTDTGEMVGLFRHGPKPQSSAHLRGSAGNYLVVYIDDSRESDLVVVPLPTKEALLPPDGGRAN